MEDNGLKVLNSVGLKMQEAEEELLEQLMESDHKPVSWTTLASFIMSQ